MSYCGLPHAGPERSRIRFPVEGTRQQSANHHDYSERRREARPLEYCVAHPSLGASLLRSGMIEGGFRISGFFRMSGSRRQAGRSRKSPYNVKRITFGTRLRPEMGDYIAAQAASNGRSVSEEIESRLETPRIADDAWGRPRVVALLRMKFTRNCQQCESLDYRLMTKRTPVGIQHFRISRCLQPDGQWRLV
jgi:hypothetical protein